MRPLHQERSAGSRKDAPSTPGLEHALSSVQQYRISPTSASSCSSRDLFVEMCSSLADRSSRKLIDRLVRIDVLRIDELSCLNLRRELSNIFFKRRYVASRCCRCPRSPALEPQASCPLPRISRSTTAPSARCCVDPFLSSWRQGSPGGAYPDPRSEPRSTRQTRSNQRRNRTLPRSRPHRSRGLPTANSRFATETHGRIKLRERKWVNSGER